MAFSEHCTLITRLRPFSTYFRKYYVSEADYDCDGDDNFQKQFRVDFYADGNCTENRGHVSIIFHATDEDVPFSIQWSTFSCTATVLDASGNKKFPRSFTFDRDIHFLQDLVAFYREGFGFEKYLKRSTLLGDSSELLPGDCLTLCLDIDCDSDTFRSLHLEDQTKSFHFEDGTLYLRVDTEFGRDLCKISNVLRKMTEYARVDRRMIGIPLTEYKRFLLIFDFLSDHDLECTITDVCELYILADKYDMQRIVQLCHQLFISSLRVIDSQDKLDCVEHEISKISELAEIFKEDERFKEIRKIYVQIKNKLYVEWLKNVHGEFIDLDNSSVSELETEWSCKFREGSLKTCFVFRKIKSDYLQMDFFK